MTAAQIEVHSHKMVPLCSCTLSESSSKRRRVHSTSLSVTFVDVSFKYGLKGIVPLLISEGCVAHLLRRVLYQSLLDKLNFLGYIMSSHYCARSALYYVYRDIDIVHSCGHCHMTPHTSLALCKFL